MRLGVTIKCPTDSSRQLVPDTDEGKERFLRIKAIRLERPGR